MKTPQDPQTPQTADVTGRSSARAAHAVVTGAGPVGTNVALLIADRGSPVVLLTRSGRGPEHPLIERRRCDVSCRGELAAHTDGAWALFHCIHGSSYNAAVWERELPGAERIAMDTAAAASIPIVFPESLYSYDRSRMPLTEDTPRDSHSGKGGVRARLLRARAAHEAATVSVVASDFYGPHVRTAAAGDLMVPRLLEGKRALVMGAADLTHSFTYVPDLAAAMVSAAEDGRLWNRVLHAPTAPAPTQRGMVELFARAAGVRRARIMTIPAWPVRAAAPMVGAARELAETMPQFTAEFVMDSSASEKLLGFGSTPPAQGAAETVRWWQGADVGESPRVAG